MGVVCASGLAQEVFAWDEKQHDGFDFVAPCRGGKSESGQ